MRAFSAGSGERVTGALAADGVRHAAGDDGGIAFGVEPDSLVEALRLQQFRFERPRA